MRLHREGNTIILVTSLILLVVNLLSYFYLFSGNSIAITAMLTISLILFVLVVQFFRVPTRALTINERQIVAPADGTVVVIEETDEPEYFKDKRRQISIFMFI